MRLRGSNSRRVTLTAGGWRTTPPRHHAQEDEMSRTTRFDGVPVKDNALADLLTQAEQQGFRLEAATNGGHQAGTGLVAYSPDTTQAPIRFGTVEVTPNHVRNIRRQLVLAGLAEPATTAPTQEDSMARTPRKSTTASKRPETLHEALDTVPVDERPQFIGHIAASALTATGGGPSVAALVGVLVETLAEWGLDPKIKAQMAEDFGGGQREQVDEALALAAAAEERATRAEAEVARLTERESKARSDCGAALDRAKAAEAKAESLEAALRPLRAWLVTGT